MRQVYEITIRDLSQIIADHIATKLRKAGPVNVSIIAPHGTKPDDVIARAYAEK